MSLESSDNNNQSDENNMGEPDIIGLAIVVVDIFDQAFPLGFNNPSEMEALHISSNADTDLFEEMLRFRELITTRDLYAGEEEYMQAEILYGAASRVWTKPPPPDVDQYTDVKSISRLEDLILSISEIERTFSHLSVGLYSRYSKIRQAFDVSIDAIENGLGVGSKIANYEVLDWVLGNLVRPYLVEVGQDSTIKGLLRGELLILQGEEKRKSKAPKGKLK